MTSPSGRVALLRPVAALGWLRVLREPQVAAGWTLQDWEHVIRIARRLRLLARVADGLQAAGALEQVPAQAQRHLLAEQRLSAWRMSSMRWALQCVGDTLAGSGCPLVLLKGAAYVGQGLQIAAGRMPSDVDVLVPRRQIAQVQACLVAAGWSEIVLDAHDSRYYHEWSHEVPPMRHAAHRIELDLHHNILPPVARTHVDAELLFARLQPSQWSAWQVLDPLDQVLHSAAHLFLDSEARDRVRDLVDLDGLLLTFAAQRPGFWDDLPQRALQLGLHEPLALACAFCAAWLGTPVPPAAAAQIARQGPSAARRSWLLPLLAEILTPSDPDGRARWQQRVAATIFLARYHRNRMPLALLLPHLWHKFRGSRVAPGDAGIG